MALALVAVVAGLWFSRSPVTGQGLPVGSSILMRSEADLRSLQAVFADDAAHDALLSICDTHYLWSVETTTDVPGEAGRACDGSPAANGPPPVNLRHTFVYLREPATNTRAFQLSYATCSVDAANHFVRLGPQGFRTRRETPQETVAANGRQFRVFCSGIRHPVVEAGLIETLSHRSIAAARVRFLEEDAFEAEYELNFLVRNPDSGELQQALRFVATEDKLHGFFGFRRDG